MHKRMLQWTRTSRTAELDTVRGKQDKRTPPYEIKVFTHNDLLPAEAEEIFARQLADSRLEVAPGSVGAASTGRRAEGGDGHVHTER